MRKVFIAVLTTFVFAIITTPSFAQAGGAIRGSVSYETDGRPLHGASVQIIQLKRTTQTDEQGSYEFTNVPQGTYSVLVHLEGFPDVVQSVQVTAGSTATLNFQLRLTGLREQVTITASGIEESTFTAMQSVEVLNSIRLTEESHPSIGEVLEKETGIAKRSFGPGNARPIVRGFDGDRVLIMQDGVRVGSLGSQSGDHGEPIDVLALERLEVVKGPATLLYGSNAIGGVVNAISGHEERHPGFRGYVTGLGGTTNNQAGLSGGVEFGHKNWLFWGNGTGQRTGDYNTPIGRIPNSKSRVTKGAGGFGYYADNVFFNAGYTDDSRRYGIPFAGLFEAHDGEDDDEADLIDLAMRSKDFRLSGGFKSASFINSFRMTFKLSDYQHKELEGDEVGTTFNNRLYTFRGVFDQRREGRLTGSFGFDAFRRNYETIGAESLIDGEVKQSNFAVFTLQSLDFSRVKLQFGGRVENNRYRPSDVMRPDRSFTGFSGGAGIRVAAYEGGAFVANYTHSYRAPSLEELYNFGPHIGNLTFEIGNAGLGRERGDGIDLGFRHLTRRVSLETNFFYYALKDFVFLALVDDDGDGVIDIEDGLPVGEYLQGNGSFRGVEFSTTIAAHRFLDVNMGLDYVRAELDDGTSLPRIPPLRGRFGLAANYKGLSIRPEVIMAKDQNRLFPTETRTPGYTVVNLLGSYTVGRLHHAHIFTVNAFNLGNRLYRNHLSFIKDLAPEIGRGVRFGYTVRFY